MNNTEHVVDIFTQNARAASSTVVTAGSLREAVDYAVRLCADNAGIPPSVPGGEEGRDILAAPDMPADLWPHLVEAGKAKGVRVIDKNVREHPNGVCVGFSVGDMGIANTGTVILRCYKEDTRLASMLAETHVIALPASTIVATSYDAEDFLQQAMAGPMYTAFISGCSRTSDIERVLTLGVHGPLSLHIILIQEGQA
ncbi:lactate utilization protein [Desulfosarcina sp. OttesenSCG-928-A07]|nr:lactate utilization protein [Desulfosarcina sp. OttesenSCG-928-G17]MDL2329630.1 lactate utilization protein [Desulfosarcina sp. OttesenSCG-928-A07]